MTELCVHAPAKINLILQVGSLDAGGYHHVDTLMQGIDLCDELYFSLNTASVLNKEKQEQLINLSIEYDHSLIKLFGIDFLENAINLKDNLVVRAGKLLARWSNKTLPSVHCRLLKRIPLQAGLGGGSSNAAATLRALAELWEIDIPSQELSLLASRLGCDVPFFLQGSCALYTGRGDRLKATLPSLESYLVLAKPRASISTKEAYAHFDALKLALSHEHKLAALECIEGALKKMPPNCCFVNLRPESFEWSNNLETVAFSLEPSLKELALVLHECAPDGRVLMSGSGSAFFVACKTQEEQEDILARLRAAWSSQELWLAAARSIDSPVHFV